MSRFHCIAIIVAAGRGTRVGGDIPKQWRLLCGKPVIEWAMTTLTQHPQINDVIIVYAAEDAASAHALPGQPICVTGAATRSGSVRAGLGKAAKLGASHVLIHDAARPCLDQDVVDGVIAALQSGAPSAAPGLPVTDALWRGDGDQITQSVSRDRLYRAQTPQGFELIALEAAHASQADAADDIALVIAAGQQPVMTQGSEQNLKITFAADFDRAARILEGKKMRIGSGYDVHKFGPGDHVILCGVKIPHDAGLVGHSDADVSMHAATDAIYGALARGDIGQHFPPSDPKWKGAASDIFLSHAVALADEMGFEIANLDCTLICEAPKIGPHADKMRANMAQIMGVDMEKISVKATTSETLGFTGRREGIAAMASVLLCPK